MRARRPGKRLAPIVHTSHSDVCMQKRRERIIFSDVDETLLEERSTRPASTRSLRHPAGGDRGGVISGRTLAELRELCASRQIDLDLIGEDGGFLSTHEPRIANVFERSGVRITTGSQTFIA